MSKLLCFNFCLVLKKVKLKIATFYKFLFPTTIRNKNPNYNLLKFYFDICSCVCAKLLQLCPTLGNPMNCSPPGSSVCGILQEEYWSRLLFLLQEILLTRYRTCFSYVSCFDRWVLYLQHHLGSPLKYVYLPPKMVMKMRAISALV